MGVAVASMFPEPWEGVVGGVILVVLVTHVVSMVNKRRAGGAEAAGNTAS